MPARSASRPAEGSPLELTSAGDVDTLVRAHGTTFLVTNRNGDIAPAGARELGFFAGDTRHLSHYELALTDLSLVHLSSDAFDPADNRVHLMVSGLGDEEFLDDPQNFIHIRRRQLVDEILWERIELVNYLQRRVEIELTLTFASDFADVFEVRGAKRPRRGTLLPPVVDGPNVDLRYAGLDGREAVTRIGFCPAPADLSGTRAVFRVALEPERPVTLHVRITTSATGATTSSRVFEERIQAQRARATRYLDDSTRFRCDNAILQHVLEQSTNDLHALTIDMHGRRVLAAGIPWFCCPFGRDTLLAAYEALIVNPDLAAASLRTLAAFQGKTHDEYTEEEPGKIFHELRFGEMARCKETPHSPYYGSIDATPLFVVVADATYRVTGDDALLGELAPAIREALSWIEHRTEQATKLVTYQRRSERGLDNQGWKDSRAGVSFPDGRRAEPPIALAEVQGYCVDAYRRGARLLHALGDDAAALTYEQRARDMTALVERMLWMPEHDRYAFAVDGRGRRLSTAVSNVGHLLWSRVPDRAHAKKTAEALVGPRSLSAFGVRTVAAGQPVYNPLSYHNGTIWPHDNAIIAKGFANYDLMDEACTVFEALVAAMAHFPDRRLPELYCGMSEGAETLVRYPVACAPQAWAAAAPFLLLQGVLGLHIDAPGQRVFVRNPKMPHSVSRLEIDGLRVGASRLSLRIRRVGKRCHVDRLDVEGPAIRTFVEIE